jgi:hypothetical protein
VPSYFFNSTSLFSLTTIVVPLIFDLLIMASDDESELVSVARHRKELCYRNEPRDKVCERYAGQIATW